MIELALLVGLGAVGYLLAADQQAPRESFVGADVAYARPTENTKMKLFIHKNTLDIIMKFLFSERM